MRIAWQKHVIALILLLACPSFFPPLTSFAANAARGDLLDRAMEALAMKKEDLRMRTDLSTNPFALQAFHQWMENPLKAPIEAQQKAMRLFQVAENPLSWLRELAEAGDIHAAAPLPLEEYSGFTLPTDLPEQLQKAIHLLLNAIYTANNKLSSVMREVPPETMKKFQKYLYPDDCPEKTSQKESEELMWMEEFKKTLDAAGNVDRKAFVDAALTILDALRKATALLTETEMLHKDVRSFSFMTGLGLVEIGGRGSDVHENEALLIIDLGGNDLYKGKVASGRDGRCSVVLDLDGNDIYLGNDATQGSGVWGIGILADLGGDDLYKAGNGSQGAGLFGIGLLVDGGGTDTYIGGRFVQAASSWGCGGLIDLAGEDTYQCEHSGQAYSGVLGVSCLCDLGGNDKYISGLNAPDPREPDMNQSFSQGFSMGMRNMAAGGFALLADKSGNDFYQCQYFGQGASYWMGIGILYDQDGNDIYIARRYAQGAGIHFSLGMLLDGGGNDHTFSWGVSQGCGHDYGIGILINQGGNDSYVSDWLSMGASEANGIGIFVDHGGDDIYETRTGMAVGHLTASRRSGGIGLFVDAGGKDSYAGKGSDNAIWAANRWGVGIDDNEGRLKDLIIVSAETPISSSESMEKRRIEERAHLSKILERSCSMPYPEKMETLLSVASHWGLEQEIPKKAQEEILNLDGEHSVPAMVNLLNTPDIMGLLFMEKFFSVHAFSALPHLLKRAEDPDPVVRSRVLYQLALIKDTRVLEACLASLEHPSWRVRSMAIRAIGDMLDKGRLDILIPMGEALNKAAKKGSPDIITEYLNEERAVMTLSVLARTFPLDYHVYRLYAEMQGHPEYQRRLDDFVQVIFSHVEETASLVARWTRDINGAKHIAQKITGLLNDPDPAVRKAAAYALGQMAYQPAIPGLLALLNDPDLWVRDSAVLSLALFQHEALAPLDVAMRKGSSSFIILGLDVLSRIKNDPSRVLIQKYLDHPDQNVRRGAERAFANF